MFQTRLMRIDFLTERYYSIAHVLSLNTRFGDLIIKYINVKLFNNIYSRIVLI